MPDLEAPHNVEADFVPRLANAGPFLPVDWTLTEEFLGGTGGVITSASSNANVGELNWNVADLGGNGDVRKQPSTAEMLGWYQVEANAGSIMGLYLGARPASSSGILIESVQHLEWRGVFNGPITPQPDGVSRFGIGQDAAAEFFGNESIWVEYAPDEDDVLRIGSRSGGVSTITPTSVVWTAGAVYECRVTIVSADQLAFYINRQLVGTHSAANGAEIPPPDTLLAFMAQAQAGAAAHQLGADRFRFKRTG